MSRPRDLGEIPMDVRASAKMGGPYLWLFVAVPNNTVNATLTIAGSHRARRKWMAGGCAEAGVVDVNHSSFE